MSKDETLIELCNSLLKEIELAPHWVKLIAVGKVKPEGGASMFAYSFDAAGKGQASAPDSATLDLLEKLCQQMTTASPTGRPWLAGLLRISSAGEVGADFEYADANRWAVTPRNLDQRVAEFAAMPV
ncbi:MAG: hypothetical protein Q4G71_07335 [Pseudomonadota bacterium]|nr:hypothetical protein [Pseudomonadota bacterium]